MNNEDHLRLLKKLNKKYMNKGWSIYVPRRRVFNSAYVILEYIEKIPFEMLTLDLYFLIADKGFEKVANDYKMAIEIAKTQPEKFMSELYDFYKKEAKYIKDNGLTEKYLEFVSMLQVQVEKDPDKRAIYYAFIQILLDQTPFLKKDVLDYNQVPVGISTDGKIIEAVDLHPNFDIPVYEIEKITIMEKKVITAQDIRNAYLKWGYNIRYESEAEAYRQQEKLMSNMTQYLMPFINEYTFDIYPETPIQALTFEIADSFPKPHLDINYSELLHSRRRTLPTNGLSVNIKNCFYKKILFKEIYKFDQVVLLYKITTEYGEFSGSYQTVAESFYSVFETIPQAENIAKGVKEFVLWLYTAYVCDCEGVTLSSDNFRTFLSDPTVELEFTQIGGKLRPAQNSNIKRLPIACKMAMNPRSSTSTDTSGNCLWVRSRPIRQYSLPVLLDMPCSLMKHLSLRSREQLG